MSDPRKALAAVDALGNLLRREIAAVEGGAFNQLVEFASEKARLTDHHHLQLARQATSEMISQVSQIREKHSIAGIYGRSGAKRDNRATLITTVDKSF